MEVLDRSHGRTPNPASVASEEASRRAGGRSGVGAVAEAVAVVSAALLTGGGAGMLGGIWLGAINPYALGLFGGAVGGVAPILLKAAVGAWGPRWRRFGG